MKLVLLSEAKRQFSSLVERAHAGEEIVIAKRGQPYARLAPLLRGHGRRRPGTLAGQIEVGVAFFEPLPRGWTGVDGPRR